MTMKELKQSETRVIKRFQINLNPINPKKAFGREGKTAKEKFAESWFSWWYCME